MSIKKKKKIFQIMRLIQITDVLCNTSVKNDAVTYSYSTSSFIKAFITLN